MPWFLEHPCDSWLWDAPKIVGTGGLLYFGFEVQKNEHCFWMGMWKAELCTVLLAGVQGQAGEAVYAVKNVVIKNVHITLRASLIT